mmetsp:Transcript_28364/g.90243  ORF Transcript_28364/g.90243 Transcript_28364/m.90243 type:complete len:725 (-) Transcript_28364:174-2348(-)
MAEADRQAVIAALVARGGGSVLRGWRRELDPDGSLDVNFLDFCKAAKSLRLSVDSVRLFGEDSPQSLTLDELAPVEGALVNRFRKWVADTFSGPSEMFMIFEPPDSDGKLTRDTFKTQCIQHGFLAPDRDLTELFNLLDGSCAGFVVMEDVSFLDMDEQRREGAIHKARMRRQYAHEHLMTEAFRENQRLAVPKSHRLAPRLWHAHAFEQLPEVVIEKRMKWNLTHLERKRHAHATFMRHLQSAYGNGVRGWRRGLDPHCRFTLTRVELARYCRTVNLDLDVPSLWKALDQDGDNAVYLEDVASKAAAALANFWLWARGSYTSCALIWDRVMAVARPPSTWKSTSSLPYGSFLGALRVLLWPGISEAGAGTALCNALDLNGCGIVCGKDLEWLDKWDAPEWLCKEPDPQAWEEFTALMSRAYGRPLRCWRHIDVDSSNEVSWAEFQDACDRVGFTGNRGGVWRYLDKNLSGSISLTEYDAPSAELLLSFKEWLDQSFGSVEYALKSMDTDGSGSLTFSELKRACKRLQWKGDVRQLFLCLDVDTTPGVRSLSYSEIAFLDSWSPASDPQEEDSTEGHGRCLPQTPPAKGVVAGRGAPAASKMQRSASTPTAGAPSLPAVPKAGRLDPCWRPSSSCTRAEIIASLRAQNDCLRAKGEQLRAQHRKFQRESRRSLRGHRPAAQRTAADGGEPSEIGAPDRGEAANTIEAPAALVLHIDSQQERTSS